MRCCLKAIGFEEINTTLDSENKIERVKTDMENAIFAEDAISINGGSFELNVRVGDQEGIFADENSEAFVRFLLISFFSRTAI